MKNGTLILWRALCISMAVVFVLTLASCASQNHEEQIEINSSEKLILQPGTKEPCSAILVGEDADGVFTVLQG